MVWRLRPWLKTSTGCEVRGPGSESFLPQLNWLFSGCSLPLSFIPWFLTTAPNPNSPFPCKPSHHALQSKIIKGSQLFYIDVQLSTSTIPTPCRGWAFISSVIMSQLESNMIPMLLHMGTVFPIAPIPFHLVTITSLIYKYPGSQYSSPSFAGFPGDVKATWDPTFYAFIPWDNLHFPTPGHKEFCPWCE